MMRCLQTCVLLALSTVFVPAVLAESHALLVGCSAYRELDRSWQLNGPVNDVALMKQVLLDRFEIAEEQVSVLSDAPGMIRPTRAAIAGAFRALTARVGRGDEVMILLAGHGTQQPDDDPRNADDFEPDGLDEVFCPTDIRPAESDEDRAVPNGITDDELGEWLKAIAAKEARVWILIDACHSGTMIRGNGTERMRQLRASTLLPGFGSEDRRGGRSGTGSTVSTRGDASGSDRNQLSRELLLDRVVALYAAQPFEVTVEKRLPANSRQAKPHGLLTYTVCQVLAQARGLLTYRELAGRVHAAYVRNGRSFPTPLLEGRGIDREVLGEDTVTVSRLPRLHRDASQRWFIDAGQIHGMTVGDILGVQHELNTTTIAHVKLSSVSATRSFVVPWKYGGQQATRELTEGARCRLEYRDSGLHQLRLAVDPVNGNGDRISSMQLDVIRTELRRISSDKASLVGVAAPDQANWLIRVRGDSVVLIPASGWTASGPAREADTFGPTKIGPRLGDWLLDRTRRIARAQNLLRLSSTAGGKRGSENAQLSVQLVRLKNEDDATGEPVRWHRDGVILKKGNLVAFRVTNDRPFPVDLSLLFVDSNFGISPYFPEPGAADNRLRPGQTLLTVPAHVTDETVGLEHMVAIAVKAQPQNQPADFGYLAQPGLERTRAASDPAFQTPIGQLLRFAMYGEGETRGLARVRRRKPVPPDHALGVVSWRVVR